MKDLHSKEQIEEMRKRLYDRGSESEQLKRHQLTDIKVDVNRNWGNTQPASTPHSSDLRAGFGKADTTETPQTPPEAESEEEAVPVKKKHRHYRSFVLIGSLLIFIFVAGLSSLYIYFGGNMVSSDDIDINIEAVSSVGGGEVLDLIVEVTNQNDMPVESATLILKYPDGTMSTGDGKRTLYEERIPMEDIIPGDTISVPVSIALFGEENQTKQINATLEYRVNDSNGMFYKDALAHSVRISSSPLVLSVSNLEKVASGQLVDITVTAVSNASTPLEDILITASYPSGFDYESSDPAPLYAENVWRIDEILPNQNKSITIQGFARGLTDESFRINFEAGPADQSNQFSVGASLADSRADFTIERPFIDVDVVINDQANGVAILEEDRESRVSVDITNTLDETVYDMVVEVVPNGNALDENSVVGQNGFYDSNTGTIRWEVANNSDFAEINPGDNRKLDFTVYQGDTKSDSSFELVVNVYARRVAESSALELLIGTDVTQGKYSSNVDLASQLSRAPQDVGPVPPQVGEVTTYTVTLVAQADANNLTNTVVETSLPLYVNWLDSYEGEGTVTYNTVSKKVQWVIGDIPRGERKELSLQLGIQPSTSQIGSAPSLINLQSVRANDGFTGALLQDSVKAVTTELSSEYGFEEDNGRVVR